jgi:DnaK suppressor protein
MDTNQFKLKLEEERQKLEEGLSRVGRRNPSNPEDWEPQFAGMNQQTSSQDEIADKFEAMEQTLAIQTTYENRLKTVTAALARIEDGSYGTCHCGKDIPKERLEADPAATCMCGTS